MTPKGRTPYRPAGVRHPFVNQGPLGAETRYPCVSAEERDAASLPLVRDAAGRRWRRDNELPVDDLGANRRCSPSAIFQVAFCAGGLRGAQRQDGDEREEKARADAEPIAAKPHRTRMARGQSSRIGRPAHLRVRQVLFSGVGPERTNAPKVRHVASGNAKRSAHPVA